MYSSVFATLSWCFRMYSRASRCWSGPSSRRRERAWRSVSRWPRSVSITSWGSLSSRSLLATADWLFPTRRAASSWVRPHWSMRRRRAAASSHTSRSLRWRFSTRASRAEVSPSASTGRQGTAASPASLAARRRRSPATSSQPVGVRRTDRGWSTPTCWMDWASSASSSGWNSFRGWPGLGRMAPSGRSSTCRLDSLGKRDIKNRLPASVKWVCLSPLYESREADSIEAGRQPTPPLSTGPGVGWGFRAEISASW